MRRVLFLLALTCPLACTQACGFAIGVDAVERSISTEDSGDGITSLRAIHLAVRDKVVVSGNAATIKATLSTVTWSRPGDPEARLGVSLVDTNGQLDLRVSGSDEGTTLTDAAIALMPGVGLSMELESGLIEARNLDSDIDIKSDSTVTLSDCSGPIRVDAPTLVLDAKDPVDVEATHSIQAQLSAGGFLVAKSISLTLDAVNGDLLASTQTASGASITMLVPHDAAFTLVIRAKSRVLIDLDDYSFDSQDPERPDDGLDIVQGITVDIGGGGPSLDLAAETNVTVRYSDI